MEVMPEDKLVRPLTDDQSRRDTPVTRAYLESLTTSDLNRMADNWGIDIPPDLDRIFIIEELLEITSQDERDAADAFASSSDESAEPEETKAADSDESAPLPRQYNITFIEVMIRDPVWAFVFWEIKTADKEQFEKVQDFDGYYLKVSPWTGPVEKPLSAADPSRKENETDGIFTVPVKPEDSAWYLGLAPAMDKVRMGRASPQDQRQYKVELCAGRRGEETVLAVSKPFRLPLLHELPAGSAIQDPCQDACQDPCPDRENPLVRLSGYGDFHILRNNERLFRAKRDLSGYL